MVLVNYNCLIAFKKIIVNLFENYYIFYFSMKICLLMIAVEL